MSHGASNPSLILLVGVAYFRCTANTGGKGKPEVERVKLNFIDLLKNKNLCYYKNFLSFFTCFTLFWQPQEHNVLWISSTSCVWACGFNSVRCISMQMSTDFFPCHVAVCLFPREARISWQNAHPWKGCHSQYTKGPQCLAGSITKKTSQVHKKTFLLGFLVTDRDSLGSAHVCPPRATANPSTPSAIHHT